MTIIDSNMVISIVVPVYKVEKYINRCIDSLINQTFKEYEIILVDDGSPDSCGTICDNYAKRYNNIRVVHKKNGGLSDARNVGVRESKGDYIVFVDSDDFVDSNYLSTLWILHKKFNTQMVFSAFIKEKEGEIQKHKQKKIKEMVVNKEVAQAMILSGEIIGTSACGKLFPREICEMHPFPEGKLMEDLHTVYYMIEEISEVAITTERNYHYVQRGGSILHNIFTKDEAEDFIQTANGFITTAKTRDIKDGAISRLIYIDYILAKGAIIEQKKLIYSLIKESLRTHIIYILFHSKLSYRKKIKTLYLYLFL